MVPSVASVVPQAPGSAQTAGQGPGSLLQMPAPRQVSQAPRRRGGRQSWPLGQPVEGTVLRGPPGLVKGEAWPPSVTKAAKKLHEVRSARCGRRMEKTRGVQRSAIVLFTYAGAIAQRGIDARPRRDGEDDLLEAFQLFQQISAVENAHHFGKYRGPALFNATVCLNHLPLRCAQGLAATLLLRAVEAIGDAALAELKGVVDDLGSRIIDKPAPVPVRWSGPTLLVPDHPEAGRRIHAFDKPVQGSWEAVRGALLTHGLVAPERNLSLRPVIEVRRGRGVLRVT